MMLAFAVAPTSPYNPSLPERNPEYLRFVRGFPCAACGKHGGIEAAHTGPHGIGQKSSDRSAIPLCRRHHRTGDQALHKLGPAEFAAVHSLDVAALVTELNQLFETQQERKKMNTNGNKGTIHACPDPVPGNGHGEVIKELRESVEQTETEKAQQPGRSNQAAAPSSQPSHTTRNGGRSEQSQDSTFLDFAEAAEAPKASPNEAVPINHAPLKVTQRFHKAVKFGAKARVAFIGVSGSGKSYTMLTLAHALAGPKGRIACIDTEHGSLSKYADIFTFDVDEPASYTVDYLLEQLDYAERNGYAVFCVDSLSHFWMGKDGALEFVDNIKRRVRDQFEGWKYFRPHERMMVDRFIASPCHILVTMRTKTDYEEQLGADGKKHRVKIGLAPVQRDGLEYEFDLVCSMDDENNLLVDKTRCSVYSQEKLRVVAKPGAAYFEPFIQWLAGAEPPPRVSTPTNRIDSGVHPNGTTAAANLPAAPKVPAVAASVPFPVTALPPGPPASASTAKRLKEFAEMKMRIGSDAYYRIMGAHGFQEASEIRSLERAREIYRAMSQEVRLQRQAAAQEVA
jgi:hypothetical protein